MNLPSWKEILLNILFSKFWARKIICKILLLKKEHNFDTRKLRLYKNDCVERVSRHFLDKGLELANQAEVWSEDILVMQVNAN